MKKNQRTRYIHTQYVPTNLKYPVVHKITILSQNFSPVLWTLSQVKLLSYALSILRCINTTKRTLLRMLRFRSLRGNTNSSLPIELFRRSYCEINTNTGLSYTNIGVLPEQIGNLINLERLEAKETDIQRIPNEILQCKRLRYLDVSLTHYSRNSTLQLPDGISSLNIEYSFCNWLYSKMY